MSEDNSDWIEALEITDCNGAKTGKFQLILRNDQHDVLSMCNHEHDTAEEALRCPDGRDFPWGFPPFTLKQLAEIAISIKPPSITINPATVTFRDHDGHSATRIVTDPPEQMQ